MPDSIRSSRSKTPISSSPSLGFLSLLFLFLSLELTRHLQFSAMAKKTPYKRKKREREQQIDNIPKYSQQPRSPAPKRRTDFSLFFRSSYSSSISSLSNALLHQAGSLLESSSGKEILSSVTIATLDDRKSNSKEMPKLPLVRCSKSQDNGQEFFPNIFEVPVIEVESVARTALQRKEHLSSCRQLLGSPDGPNNSNQQDQSSDKWNNSSGSSRTESNFLKTRRGKRTRKPKVHFDEVTCPLRSVRKVRRLRIMRYLGLAAPIGSPFSFTHPHLTAWTHFFC